MKKMFFRIMAIVAVLSVGVACNKETAIDNGPEKQDQVTPESGKKMTITVKLSDALTKVSFDPVFVDGNSNNKPQAMAHKWETGDKLRITNASNQVEIYDLTEGAGTNLGTFEGNLIENGPFSVEVIPEGEEFDTDYEQTQDRDGDTSHLRYVASADGIEDLSSFELSETSQIIAVIAKLPADVAVTVNSLEIVTSVDDFANTTTLKVNLAEQEDVDTDDFLKIYANAPASWSIPVGGAKMLLRFNSVNANHTVYTRYEEFTAGVAPEAGKFNYIRMDCSHIDQYAGKADNGTSAHPYLIADKYQLQAMRDLMEAGATKCFKLVDNIDMTGETWSYLNQTSPYSELVDLDGNGKTVSNLGASLFYVLKGAVRDLTLESCTIGSGSQRGVLAQYIQGTGNEITNVDITNGSVPSGSNAGALIGRINSGTDGTTTATITDCNITGTTVNGTVAGGLIGSVEAEVIIANCTVSDGSVTGSSANDGGLIGNLTKPSSITDCSVTGTDVTGGSVVGGLVGFANTLITMSGCTYSGGTVSSSGRFCGGMFGSIGDFASEISDCHVTNATITSSSDRVGGFTGQIGRNGATVKGCTVGTSGAKVAVHSSLSGDKNHTDININMGGFVGVCYGIVTKNGDVRNEAHVTITCDNTYTSINVNIGGFVGYLEKGAIDYSDADATLSSIKGHQVGGFAAFLTAAGACTIDNCTSNATVSGNNYVGGFIGQAAAADHTISNNSSAGTVSGAATVAGFIGQAGQGTLTKNSTSCAVTASGANSGGFAGQLNGAVTVSKCFTTGSVDGKGNVCGGFTAIASNGATINDCYSTGNLLSSTRKRGGIAGHVDAGTVSINRCYSTSNISNNFEMGGLVGVVAVETFTMTKCAAWNETLVASSREANNWSSAACVGVTYLTCTLTDNYRNPNMDSLIYWGTNEGCSINLPNSFQHPDVSPSAPLTDPDGVEVTSTTMRPYQGKCDASKTLSQLASTTLGWSSDIWDFSGDYPTLK